MSAARKKSLAPAPTGNVDPVRLRAELLIANLTDAVTDLGDRERRREARRYIASVWRGAAGVELTPGAYYRVIVVAMQSAYARSSPTAQWTGIVDDRVRLVRGIIRLTFPEVEPGIADETFRNAVQRWPTRRHDRWEALRALLWALGLRTTKVAGVKKGIARAMKQAAVE